ncbi:MAG TPA: amidohydrolase family protein [Candidatus Limnocylindria bacterium]|nr:amidohydrolase family protein [Candidatus Limnocylindria bacterium]
MDVHTGPMISSDSHIVEPPDLWERWLPKELRPLAPKLVKDEEGGDAWLYNDGGAPAPLGLVTVTRGRAREELRWSGARYATINQGNFEATARVAEMLEDGVVAEVIYSPQRTMRHFMQGTDNDLHLAGVRAYNDWLANDFCAKAPDRLIGIAQMPATGVEDAIAEMRRALDMGLRGVLLSSWPSGNPNVSEADDPFFAEAQKRGVPVSLHIGLVSRAKVAPKPRTPVDVDKAKAATGTGTGGRQVSTLSGAGLDTMPLLLGEIILTGVHDRFPDLKFVSVEAGIGWVPYYAEQMDDRYERNRHWAKIKLRKRPSEYIRSNWMFTFVLDRYGVVNRHAIGIENIMWSTDYPHHGCDWPHSRRTVAAMFEGVPAAERQQIVYGNAARLYGITVTA